MRRKIFYFVVLILIVGMAGIVQAGTHSWKNGKEGGRWEFCYNWDPAINYVFPGPVYDQYVGPNEFDTCYLRPNQPYSDPDINDFAATALLVSDEVEGSSGTMTWTLRNGASLATPDIWLGEAPDLKTTMHMQSDCGTVSNTDQQGQFSFGYDGSADVNMDGGVLDFNEVTLAVGSYYRGSYMDAGVVKESVRRGYGHIQLDGGKIIGGGGGTFPGLPRICGTISLDRQNTTSLKQIFGSIDITGGTMVLEGDWRRDRPKIADDSGTLIQTPRSLSSYLYNRMITAYADPNLAAGPKQDVNTVEDPNGYVKREYIEGSDPNTLVSAEYAAVDQAYNWDPLYIGDPCHPTISWTPAPGATAHKVYFGTDPTNPAYKTEVTGANSWQVDETLDFEQLYYYRIDEVISASQIPGITVDFTTRRGRVSNQRPPNNGYRFADNDVNILWGRPGGGHGVEYRIFIAYEIDGNDFNDSDHDDANDYFNLGSYIATTANDVNIYQVTTILDKEYYWRVDTVVPADSNYWLPGDAKTELIFKGDVWHFTTHSYFMITEFESYVDRTKIPPELKFGDGQFSDSWDTTPYTGTGIGIEMLADLHIKPKGHASMWLEYDNTYISPMVEQHYYSEAVYDYMLPDNGGQDANWMKGDLLEHAAAFSLLFHGSLANDYGGEPNQMYIAVEDIDDEVAIVKYGDHGEGDAYDLVEKKWHQWDVALQWFDANNSAIDLNHVEKYYIGVGVRGALWDSGGLSPNIGGEGTLYFDNIYRWPRRCRPLAKLSADVDGDCDADIRDIRDIGDAWLLHDEMVTGVNPGAPDLWYKFNHEMEDNEAKDSAPGARHCLTISNTWDTGGVGSDEFSTSSSECLYFDGSKYVDVPNADTLWNPIGYEFSLAVWMYRDENPWMDRYSDTTHGETYWGKGTGGREFLLNFTPSHQAVGGAIFRAGGNTTDWKSADSVAYLSQQNDGLDTVLEYLMQLEQGWNHFTLIKECATEHMGIYLNSVNVAIDDNNLGKHIFGLTDFIIGDGLGGGGGDYEGLLDECRVYGKRLSQAEIVWAMDQGPQLIPMPFWAQPCDLEVDGRIDFVDFAQLAAEFYLDRGETLWP